MAFWWNVIASASSWSRTTSAPPTTSLCPPTYLVVEWTTTSAPRVSGCWRYGEAKVLSTTSSAPASWATEARASMSPMVSIGLVGVSTQTSLVLTGPDRGADGVDVAHRGRAVVEAPDLLDLVEEAERAAVRVVGDDGVVAGPGERTDQGVLGGQPAGEGEAALTHLDGGQRTLQRGAGGVGRAAVLVAAAQAADTVLLVGAGGVDGRDHRSGHLVRLVARVDRPRLETGLARVFVGGHGIEGRPGLRRPRTSSGKCLSTRPRQRDHRG